MSEQEVLIEDGLDEEQDEEQEETLPFKYSITSYGADYPVDGLVKRLQSKDIFVPSFQRGYVWTFPQASRFVESLLLGLPVPGIFLSKEQETQKLLVIDGQQRLRTLQFFYEGMFEPRNCRFTLSGVQYQFQGQTYDTLHDEERRRLDDAIVHATVVKQDEPSDDDSSVYQIFERLNTGGRLLKPQQIRACIYHGEFNDLLGELNRNATWREVYGPEDTEMKDQELILRFLALHFNLGEYKRPMKEFLNTYMARNRHLKLRSAGDVREAFVAAIETIHRSLGSTAFKPERRRLNRAVFDAVMCGTTVRLQRGPISSAAFQGRYRNLVDDQDFIAATKAGTSDEENVRGRIGLAIEAFKTVS